MFSGAAHLPAPAGRGSLGHNPTGNSEEFGDVERACLDGDFGTVLIGGLSVLAAVSLDIKADTRRRRRAVLVSDPSCGGYD